MDHSFTTEIPVLDVQDHHIGVYHYGTKYHTIIPLWYQIYSIHYGTNSFWSNFVIVVRVCRWLNPDVSSHSWWNPPSINKYFRYNDMIWGYKYIYIYVYDLNIKTLISPSIPWIPPWIAQRPAARCLVTPRLRRSCRAAVGSDESSHRAGEVSGRVGRPGDFAAIHRKTIGINGDLMVI